MAQRETTTVVESRKTGRVGMNCSFSDIPCPGFWVNDHTGLGFRITQDSLHTGHSPVIGYVGNYDQFTLVNPDAYAPIGKLRKETADLDLPVNF